jgi:hypothetical protein
MMFKHLRIFCFLMIAACDVSVSTLPVSSCSHTMDRCEDGMSCQRTEDGSHHCVASSLNLVDVGFDTQDERLSSDANPTLDDIDATISANPNCNDGHLNAGESDIDCGGPCVPCAVGGACARHEDCASTICEAEVCVQTACGDQTKNGSESDIDCGGDCALCPDSSGCNHRTDCMSGVCSQGQCASPDCNDLVLNGAETNIDCGGDCNPCVDCASDNPCPENAHCLAGQCSPRLENGQACAQPESCQSGYCANGFCCASGDCCDRKRDCVGTFDAPAICEVEAECRGHRIASVCRNHRCKAKEIADDSACTQAVVASECDAYPSVGCNGTVAQQVPVCAEQCNDDSECDEGFRCQSTRCVINSALANGEACYQSGDCESLHCQNGYCCSEGDCCNTPTQCSGFPGVQAACESPSNCQGSRTEVSCSNHRCTTAQVDDDSACSDQTVADQCGLYSDRLCNGQEQQTAPACNLTCSVESDCDAGAWCGNGTCNVRQEQASGNACTNSQDCASRYCQNGFCCSAGDCCSTASDCPNSGQSNPECANPSRCQGTRLQTTCQNHTCSTDSLTDDSACAGMLATTCGLYRTVYCSDSQSQSPPVCPTSCSNDDECIAGARCRGSRCSTTVDNGGSCTQNADCSEGHCRNGFCCSGGDCCASAEDCPAGYAQAPTCNDMASCQGTRVAKRCVSNRCGSAVLNNDSACSGFAIECFSYPDVYCNGASVQAQRTCATSCEAGDASSCSTDYQCVNARCVPTDELLCRELPQLCP